MKNIFAKYDKELAPYPQPFKDKQDEQLLGSGWTKADGRIPGVFDNKPSGSKSISSVQWSADGGVNGPNQVWPLEFMPSEAVLAELLDLAYRENLPRQGLNLADQILPFVVEYIQGVRTPEVWMRDVIDFLRKHRGAYPQFTCPWDPPVEKRVYIVKRSGWSY